MAMRYEVGKTYAFIRVDFIPKQKRFSSLYLPGIDELKGIHVAKMTCVEHHKVKTRYGDEEVDGFIFKDETGKIWYNQYPIADYGQTTDTLDWELLEPETAFGKRWTYAEVFFDTILSGLQSDEIPEENKEHLRLYKLDLEDELRKAGFSYSEGDLSITLDDGRNKTYPGVLVSTIPSL